MQCAEKGHSLRGVWSAASRGTPSSVTDAGTRRSDSIEPARPVAWAGVSSVRQSGLRTAPCPRCPGRHRRNATPRDRLALEGTRGLPTRRTAGSASVACHSWDAYAHRGGHCWQRRKEGRPDAPRREGSPVSPSSCLLPPVHRCGGVAAGTPHQRCRTCRPQHAQSRCGHWVACNRMGYNETCWGEHR